MMNHIFKGLLIVFSLISTAAYAQQPAGNYSGKKIGSIKGQVKDEQSNQMLEFATVSVFKSDSILLGGSMTDAKGNFTINGLKVGLYSLKVSFMGFEPKTVEGVEISSAKPMTDVGVLFIVPSSELLESVEIKSEKEFMVNTVDRKVYEVSKNLNTKGGTLSDVLENIPSVELDMDGTLRLRGSENIRILINGKVSAMTSGTEVLKQIPSSSIERVEVITNPSAKYDAEGMAGILNIILKKNTENGFNGNVSLTGSTTGSYNSSVGFNLRNRKVNLAVNYGYNNFQRKFGFDSHRLATIEGEVQENDQIGEGSFQGGSHFVRTAADFYINDKNTLTAGITANVRDFGRPEANTFNYLQTGGLGEYMLAQSRSEMMMDNSSFGGNMSFVHDFKKKGHMLSADVNYSQSSGGGDNQMWQQKEAVDPLLNEEFVDLYQYSINDSENDILIVQSDYARPLKNGSVFEAGVKSTISNRDNDFRFYDVTGVNSIEDLANPDNGERMLNEATSTHMLYEEQVHAAYLNVSGKWRKYNYQAGFRAEQTLASGDMLNQDGDFTQNYLSLFPSIFISRKMGEDKEFKLSYSKRIQRVPERMLMPVVDKSNPNMYRVGNPQLLPEKNHSLEASFGKYWGEASLTSSAYLRVIRDDWQRFITVKDGQAYMNYNNIKVGATYGFEFIASMPVTDWYKLDGNLNCYVAEYDSKAIGLDNASFSYIVSLNNRLTLWKGGSMQVTGRYTSRREVAMGEYAPIAYMDIAANQQVLKNKGTISLQFSDVFNTRKFKYTMYNDELEEYSVRNYQTQAVRLSFSYRFGKRMKPKGPRKRRSNNSRGRDNFSDIEME